MKNKKGGPSSNSKPTNAQMQMQSNQIPQPVNSNVNNVPSLFTNADQQRAANMANQIPVQQMQMPVQQMQMNMPQMQQPQYSNIMPTPFSNAQQAQVRNVSGGYYGARTQAPLFNHPPQEQINGYFNDD